MGATRSSDYGSCKPSSSSIKRSYPLGSSQQESLFEVFGSIYIVMRGLRFGAQALGLTT